MARATPDTGEVSTEWKDSANLLGSNPLASAAWVEGQAQRPPRASGSLSRKSLLSLLIGYAQPISVLLIDSIARHLGINLPCRLCLHDRVVVARESIRSEHLTTP